MSRGRVVRVTRRYVDVCDESYQVRRGRLASQMDVCVGDLVGFSLERDTIVVNSMQERSNLLRRAYGKKTKYLGANVDRVYVVAAPLPLFNNSMIDRLLAAAGAENIACSIVMNKVDLEAELKGTKALIEIYEALGMSVCYASAKTDVGLEQLRRELSSPELSVVALAGVSGVGKSTILNQLIPDVEVRTRKVSEKTGQGRQTTAQSKAFMYPRGDAPPLFLIDLPGIQNYGITHLNEEELRHGFLEFRTRAEECRFANCKHRDEPDCAVLKAREAGEVSEERYQSYREMLEEIESFVPWE